jgi:hypothetical protein
MPKDSRCKAKTKAGKSCRAAATAGGLCFFHSNPNKARELGQKGGRKNRHVHPQQGLELANLRGFEGALELTEKLMKEVYSGDLAPKTASTIVSILSLRLKLKEFQEMDSRLKQLENRQSDQTEEESPAQTQLVSVAAPLIEHIDRKVYSENQSAALETTIAASETKEATDPESEGLPLQRVMKSTGNTHGS